MFVGGRVPVLSFFCVSLVYFSRGTGEKGTGQPRLASHGKGGLVWCSWAGAKANNGLRSRNQVRTPLLFQLRTEKKGGGLVV